MNEQQPHSSAMTQAIEYIMLSSDEEMDTSEPESEPRLHDVEMLQDVQEVIEVHDVSEDREVVGDDVIVVYEKICNPHDEECKPQHLIVEVETQPAVVADSSIEIVEQKEHIEQEEPLEALEEPIETLNIEMQEPENSERHIKKRRRHVKGSIAVTRRSSRIATVEEKPAFLLDMGLPIEERKPEFLLELPPPTRKRKRVSTPPPTCEERPGTSASSASTSASSASDPSEPMTEQKPDTIVPKKARVQRTTMEPSRRSGRINKENETTVGEDPLLANFNESNGVMDRGVNIPIGLTRVPFQFKVKDDDRLKNKLRINMQPTFTPAGPVSQGFPAERSKARSAEPTDSTTFMNRAKGEIRVGDDFQAEVSEFEEPDRESRKQEEDRDEVAWSPPNCEDDFFYKTLREDYWRAIWRQFESHIPMEVALKHLMEHDFNMGKSLETIDQALEVLPQKFKPLGTGQVKHFLLNKKKTRRVVQEKAMRNYHISEVQHFRYRFRKFTKYQDLYGIRCNCYEPLCNDLTYEPRWACYNCTKAQRPKAESDKFCLICIVYKQLTGRKRPCKNVVFDDEDAEKIRKWRELEDKAGKAMSREEFEKALKADTVARWKREELTAEEHEMLYKKEIRKGDDRGEKIVAQLTPWVLPHFTKCNCCLPMTSEQKALQVSRKPAPMKFSFNVKEQENYSLKLWNNKGNVHATARELSVPREWVVHFIHLYGGLFNLYEYYTDNNYPEMNSDTQPPSGEAPPLPEIGASRDNSPYLPPGEKKKRKSN